MNNHLGAARKQVNETSFHAVMWRLKEHFKMNCIRGNQTHIEGSDPRLINPPHPSHQDQSHLMALTSEWGHSVFELHGVRDSANCNQVKHPSEIPYKPPIREEQNVSGLMRSTEAASFVTPVYGHRQDALTDYSISGPHFHVPEKIKQEEEEQNYSGYSAPKNERPQQESLSEEDRPFNNPELPKANAFHQEEHSKQHSSDEGRNCSPGRKLRVKHGKLSNEEILARRAAQAAAQREVRRRRREKLTPEELREKLAALAAAQREARRRQRERMTEEELQLRRTLSAITQKEIRKRKLSSMTEEELKAYRAREASRQKELRLRKRMLMSEEDLKMLKAKEAAASAARRARRLDKESKACFSGEEPDPSPS